jgi:hypothetical protein
MMKQYIILIAIIAVVFLAIGCAAPVPVPTPTTTSTPAPTATAGPTLIGGSDEAHVIFNYGLRTYHDFWGQTASPGMVFYIMHANVTSDKPVECTPDWFALEYRVNNIEPVKTAYPVSNRFNSATTQSGVYATGEIEFELPDQMAEGYPKAVFWKPVDRQNGIYKVKQPIYGVPGVA